MVSKIVDDLNMIAGYNGLYAINRNGDVFRKQKNGKWKKLTPYKIAGYDAVGLCINGKRIIKHVHRLLAITYIPNPLNKGCVNHIDGNKLNNDLQNLEWATYSENSKHAFKHGLSRHHGENNGSSKITNDLAKEIFLLRNIYKQKDLCKMFGLTPTMVNNIVKRRFWKRATEGLN
ncbi:MAG TPA: HNH endonuclease [Sphingobacteriaceae bacterium]|nr:HNH endonuclease [Sphingobacteriaceae bacterium]